MSTDSRWNFEKNTSMMRTSPFQLNSDWTMNVKITPEFSRCMGRFGLTYTAFNISVVFFTSLFITAPEVYKDNQSDFKYVVLAMLFIAANVIANFILFGRNKSFYSATDAANVPRSTLLPDSSWSHCPSCDHMKPARAHHCILCHRCILKRDHHCFFVGSCVGFYNQRYFVFFCFYAFVGAAYGFYMAVIYLSSMDLHIFSSKFYQCSFPIALINWLFWGSTSFSTLLMIGYANLCCVTAIGAGGFAFFQFFITAAGVTLHEFGKNDWSYRTNTLEHIRSVFGPNWLLNFIFPMP